MKNMEMKKLSLVFIVIGIALIGIILKDKAVSKEFSEEELTKVSQGNIQVTVVFLNPKYPDLTRPTFYIRLDTHSGDLYIYDMLESVTLEVAGKKFSPVTWKEDEKSWGHHRYGFMEFPEEAFDEINREMNFRLIVNIDGERVLEWKA